MYNSTRHFEIELLTAISQLQQNFSMEKSYKISRYLQQGRVVRKSVNANPGLKVNRSLNFSCIKMIFTAYVLCSLGLVKLKTEGQTV